ncbi:ribosome biogenesis GTP-binding protein YsxC [Neisseria flavescens NRL30031/H210]|uniref:Probable GTP-binding protein EngB n=2 Tax=Neisseria flavescens TaxID=484 RepID=C0EPW9_NEIFL|nr:ribosome biogenesis GTP-binding protein YsxC [Neisseria flavescens NRL30031/H210]
MPDTNYDVAVLFPCKEILMNLFQNAKFFTTVNHLKDLPDTPAEIAFVGRSNAGKSSAINTLTNHVRLAYVSKTPGRTQHINFFELENGNFMVDLPGYGYAQVPEAIRAHWVKLLGDYLQQRRQLIGLILIMDSRHPLKALDIQMLDFFHITGRPVHILLSKADKLSKNDQIKTLAAVKKSLKPYTERQKISVQLFSSLKKQGMDEVNQVVGSWFDAHREEIENLAGETPPE